MRWLPRSVLTALWLLCMGFLVAPSAQAVTNKDHPSSDAPWLIGLLVLVLLGGAATMLLFRRGASRRDQPGDFRR
jgi:hypothetical protein